MSLMSAKKLLMGGARKLRPQDVFATALYTGSGVTKSISNGLDLAGKGGLVWLKSRSTSGRSHNLVDTVRGSDKTLRTDTSDSEFSGFGTVMSFGSAGFSVGTYSQSNQSGDAFASWSFRRAKKFFDIVTYTGNGQAGRRIPHGLGTAPGMIVVKVRSQQSDWAVYHRSRTKNKSLFLNATNAEENSSIWAAEPDADAFYVGIGGAVNVDGLTYVAYLFAQNSDLIDCGSYVGNGSSTGPLVTCGSGWRPQFLLLKGATASAGGSGVDWTIYDSQRSFVQGDTARQLRANLANSELQAGFATPTASGFQLQGTGYNVGGATYIYLAIRSPT